MVVLETERLILRPFQVKDHHDYIQMNADPTVMRYFPRPYSEEESRTQLRLFHQQWDEIGYSFSAVIDKESGAFLGMAGLAPIDPNLPIAPNIQIGWRFKSSTWGKGYAFEAANMWLEYGFNVLGVEAVLSYAPRLNRPSLGLMRRLGMSHRSELSFEHPAIPQTSDLRVIEVYELRSGDFRI